MTMIKTNLYIFFFHDTEMFYKLIIYDWTDNQCLLLVCKVAESYSYIGAGMIQIRIILSYLFKVG